MITTSALQTLLAASGTLRSQPASEWTGPFALPDDLARFYTDVGPDGLTLSAYGNAFSLPALRDLWGYQAGYRWNAVTGEPIADWQDDWLVVADQGADPFIYSRATGGILSALHGAGRWEPEALFADIRECAAVLGTLGRLVDEAGDDFLDEDCYITPSCLAQANAALTHLLGSASRAQGVLDALEWIGAEAAGA